MRLLRNQGMERQYANEVVGFNARMTDIHAAIGRVQLTKVDAWTERPAGTTPPSSTRTSRASSCRRSPSGATHVYHQYTIRVDGGERDRVVTAMREEHQVGSGVYYPIPNHQLASLAKYAPGLELPVTAAGGRRGHLAAGPPVPVRGRPRAHRDGGQRHRASRRLTTAPAQPHRPVSRGDAGRSSSQPRSRSA